MDTFYSVITLVTNKSQMASIDLRYAYYSVPIAKEHQRFLRFHWNGNCSNTQAYLMGFPPHRISTKLLKHVYSSHVNDGYTNDCLLLGDTIEKCNKSKYVNDTVELMSKLSYMKTNLYLNHQNKLFSWLILLI